MKVQVTRLLHPSRGQLRYRVRCDEPETHVRSDILPDAMAPLPAWLLPTVDEALMCVKEARPWKPDHTAIIITIEIV